MSDPRNNPISAPLLVLFSLIYVLCQNNYPSPRFKTSVKKRVYFIMTSGDGGHLTISIAFSAFASVCVGGCEAVKCCPASLKWHVNNPVISVMCSVRGVIKSFSFEGRSNFEKVADECSFRCGEEAEIPGRFGSSG